MEIAPGLHSMSILTINKYEFNITCDNTKCNFNETRTTRELAKEAAWLHLIEILHSGD